MAPCVSSSSTSSENTSATTTTSSTTTTTKLTNSSLPEYAEVTKTAVYDRSGSNFTASTVCSESPSVDTLPSPESPTKSSIIGHIELSSDTGIGCFETGDDNNNNNMVVQAPEMGAEDDASAAEKHYGGFEEDDDGKELDLDDVFASNNNNNNNTKPSPANDFTVSFSAKNVPRRDYRKTPVFDDSVRANTARGVPRTRNSNSKYGYEDASPDADATQDSSSIFDASSKSIASFGGSSRRDSFFGTVEGLEDLDASSRSVPSRGVTRKSSMKRQDSISSTSSDKGRRSTMQFSGEIQVYLPGKNTPVVKRRSISFNKNVVIRPIAPAVENAEPHELWVQKEELKQMQQSSIELVDNIYAAAAAAEEENGAGEGSPSSKEGGEQDCEDAPATEDCIRGLEALMDADLKMERKYDAWDSVLNEQDMQRNEGTFDDLDIAHVYKDSTIESCQEALERAKKDEDEVRLYLRGTLHENRRSSM